MALIDAQQRVSAAVSMVAPTKGINDIDPLAATDEGFCIFLRDMFPSNAADTVRAGTKEWATNIKSATTPYPLLTVYTLMPFNGMNGSQQFYAATNKGIFDITASIDTPVLVHPLTDGNVNFVQFSNPAGQFLIGCNGIDPAFLYDGSSWVDFTKVVTPVAPGEISGIDPALFSSVIVFKNRLWFVEKDSMTAWYLPTDAVAGVAVPFLLGGIFQRGGYLYEMATWSFDSGVGLDDNLIFRSSAGEVAVYKGTDPDDVSTFALVSVYFVSAPIGKISHCDLGGDIIMLTRSGLVPISKVVQGAATESLYENTLSKNINKTLNRLVHAPTFTNNWEIHNIPSMQALMVIIPATSQSRAVQYIMNVLTGAWAEYSLTATCLSVFNGVPYFGTAIGKVYKHDPQEPTRDNVSLDGTGGIPITGTILTAFSYFGDPATLKHFKLVRPIVQAASNPRIRLSLAMDFQLDDLTTFNVPALSASELSLWDSAEWDRGVWGSARQIYRPWTGVTGLGFAAALRMDLTVIAPTSFVAYEVLFESGGAI